MKKMSVFALLLLFAVNAGAQKNDPAAGKTVFSQNCTACHSITKEVVGPALKDVDKRRSQAWIISFVHSPQKMINSGDTAAVRLFNSHNKILMPNHPGLNDGDIKNIIAYISAESNKTNLQPVTAEADDNSSPYPGKNSFLHQLVYMNLQGDFKPISLNDHFIWLVIFIAVVLLITALAFAVKVQTILDGYGKHSDAAGD